MNSSSGSVTATNSGSFTNNGLSANISYTFNIMAIGSGGGFSSTVTTSAAVTLASVSVTSSNFYVSSSTTTSVTFTWATNATFSYISIAPVSGVTSGTSGGTVGSYVTQTTTATSATLSGLNSNAYYYLSIIPYNTAGAGASAVSSYNGIYTRAVVSSATSTTGGTSLTVSVTGFYAYFTWKNNTTNTSGTVNNVNGGAFTDSGLNSNSSYTYNITPYNSAGVSGSLFVTSSFSTIPPVFVLGPYNISPWGTTTQDANAQWIWYEPNGTSGTSNYYCHFYKSFYSSTAYTGTGYGAFDNTGTVTINGNFVGNIGGGWGGNGNQFSFSVIVGTNNIDIYGANQGGPGGVICTFYDNNNNVVVHTDSSWAYIRSAT
jgi:hypothetical protein